jgi:integrase
MAISKYEKNGVALYRVRAFYKSAKDPDIRITKQVGGLRSESEAARTEARLSKEIRDQGIKEEARRVMIGKTWSGVLHHWYRAQLNVRVPFGAISRTTLDDTYGGVKKCMARFDNLPCCEITPLDLMRVFNELSERGASAGHKQKMRSKIKAIFEHGIQHNLIALRHNPVHDLVIRKGEERKPEILSIGEIRRLVQLAFIHKHDWRYVWSLALLTGMRNGELFALRWTDIDWDQKLITAARSYNGRIKKVVATKAGYWRDVPLSSDAVRLLLELKPLTAHQEYVLPRLDRWANGIQAAVLRSFCLEHGLPSVRFHTLRACFGTQLLRQGVPAVVVMKIAGWRDLKTMQRYIRLAGVEVAGATEKLSVLPPEEVAANVVAFRSRG